MCSLSIVGQLILGKGETLDLKSKLPYYLPIAGGRIIGFIPFLNNRNAIHTMIFSTFNSFVLFERISTFFSFNAFYFDITYLSDKSMLI